MLFTGLGRSVLGKTVPSVSSTALGLRPRAVLETSGTVFPNTDRPRPVNNIYILNSPSPYESSFLTSIYIFYGCCAPLLDRNQREKLRRRPRIRSFNTDTKSVLDRYSNKARKPNQRDWRNWSFSWKHGKHSRFERKKKLEYSNLPDLNFLLQKLLIIKSISMP